MHILFIDELVWSKLESGRLPSLPEFKELIGQKPVHFSSEPLVEVAS